MYRLEYVSCRGERGIIPRVVFCFCAKREELGHERSKMDLTSEVLWADADIYLCRPDQYGTIPDLGLFIGRANVQSGDRRFGGFDLIEPDGDELWEAVLPVPGKVLTAIERERGGKDLFGKAIFRVVQSFPRAPNLRPMWAPVYGKKGSNYPFVDLRVPESDWERTLHEFGYFDMRRLWRVIGKTIRNKVMGWAWRKIGI